MAAWIQDLRFAVRLCWKQPLFTAVALVLAVMGTYGVMAYAVNQQTHSLGIRLALGAQRGDIRRWILGSGLRRAGYGLALGLGGALALGPLLGHFLHGVSPYDLMTYTAVSILLSGVVALACYLPARRAMRLDPLTALRHE